MSSTDIISIRQSRKNYMCDWCYESIKKGESYKKYFVFGDAVTCRYHPECYDAMVSSGVDEWVPGTFKRGSAE